MPLSRLLPLLLLTCLPHQEGAQPAPSSPPGLLPIPGGETVIGSSFESLAELLASGSSARQKGQWLLAEHPQHTREVEGFFMMVSEVTNEQYLAFVQETGAQPPLRWARPAVDAACAQFVEETGAARARAREASEPLPPRMVFNEDKWWQRHWRECEWEMPPEVAAKPVVRVTHADASRYAHWAGLRLPTEFEYERAVRGATTHNFPWGAEWLRDSAATLEMEKTDELRDVGSFPTGTSVDGVVDLIGNVWEWTDSPYEAYPDWTARAVVLEGRGREHRIDDQPAWDPSARVTRGGSQSTDPVLTRASSRQGAARYHRSSTLGFRCVASTLQQVHQARVQIRSVPHEVRPPSEGEGDAYAPEQALMLHRWLSELPDSRVPGYRVIKSHEAILFTPVTRAHSRGINELRVRARPTELQHIGVLSTDVDLVHPELPAGTYLVAIRGAGEMLQPKREEKARAEGRLPPLVSEQLALDRGVDNLVYLSLQGAPLVGVPLRGLSYGAPRRLDLGWRPAMDAETASPLSKFELAFFIPGRNRSGLRGSIEIQFTDPNPALPWLAMSPRE